MTSNNDEEYHTLIIAAREAWLDKIMKFLLPKLIYERSKHTCYDDYIRKWMKKNHINFAENEETHELVILRDDKPIASWNPKG